MMIVRLMMIVWLMMIPCFNDDRVLVLYYEGIRVVEEKKEKMCVKFADCLDHISFSL